MARAADAWEARLRPPDPKLRWYRDPAPLLEQLRSGVRLGYSGPREGLGFLVRANHPSADMPVGAAAIDAEIRDELARGRMAGPFTLAQLRERLPFFINSPMAAVDKPDGGKRIIDDMTYDAASNSDGEHAAATAVNAHISDEDAAVRYASFDEALRAIRSVGDGGRGVWLAKIDWKAAFRQIAVYPDDWPLLGLQWRDMLFIRLVLPFGARSSPRLFTQFARAFAGILRRCPGVKRVVYYLDDFLLIGSTQSECQQAVDAMESLARELGVELHPTKRDGPAQLLTFLGIGIDTVLMRVFLPIAKKHKLRTHCSHLIQRRAASLHQLRSVAGLMLHAAQVVQPGRIMARRVLEFKRPMEERDRRDQHRGSFARHVRHALPDDVLDDLRWWTEALDHWDGVSMMRPADDYTHPLVIETDAATSDGAGAVLFDTAAPSASTSAAGGVGTVSRWLHYHWPATSNEAAWLTWPIASLELAAITIALHSFGPLIRGRSVRIHTDSTNASFALSRTATTSPLHMRLLRGIHATAVLHDIHIHLVSHIKGTHNVFADAASRLCAQTTDQLAALGLTPDRRLQEPHIPDWLRSLAMPPCSSTPASPPPHAASTGAACVAGESSASS